jgi:hypothetical protein
MQARVAPRTDFFLQQLMTLSYHLSQKHYKGESHILSSFIELRLEAHDIQCVQ